VFEAHRLLYTQAERNVLPTLNNLLENREMALESEEGAVSYERGTPVSRIPCTQAERNVLPTLNNLLENREMALDDGRFLLSAARYDALAKVFLWGGQFLASEVPL